MNWDSYFFNIAQMVAYRSNCMSRKIGAVLVREKVIICTGYNGPPRGTPHCSEHYSDCPRRIAGYGSGEGLEMCPAIHAEQNCIAQAARLGIEVKGASIYMTCEIPCKTCMGLLVNAGVSKIICKSTEPYDDITSFVLHHSNVNLRTFDFL